MPGIYVEIIGNASQFKRELDGAVRSTAKANSGFHKMGRAAGVAGLALAGGLTVALVHAAKGALQDAASNNRLAASFKASHVPIDQFKDKIAEAEEAGVKLGFMDEDVAESLGTLVTATHSGKKAFELMGTAEDIARYRHVNLEAASKMLTATMGGNTRAAKALGIILLPVTSHMDALKEKYKDLHQAIPPAERDAARYADRQLTAARAIGLVNEKLHGQAQAFVETGTGKAAVFKAQMDQLSDNLGKNLLPAINDVLDKLNVFAAWMVQHPALVKAVVIALGGLAAALIAVSVATMIMEAALSPVLLPLAALTVAIGVLSFVVYKLVTDFKHNWDLLLPIVLGPIGLIILAIKRWHTEIAAAFTAAWNAVKKITSAAISALLGLVRGAVGAAGAAAKAVGKAILDGVMDHVRDIAGKVKGAFGKVWTALQVLAATAFTYAQGIGEMIIAGVVSGLAGLFHSIVSHATAAVKGAIKAVRNHIPGGSPLWHYAMENIGEPIAHGAAMGILNGTAKLRQSLIGSVADAKSGVDDWIGSEGVANMTEQGGILSTALSRGIAAHDLVAGMVASGVGYGAFGSGDSLGGSPLASSTPLGASSLVNPPVVINVAGSVVTERQLIDAVQDGLNRKQRRNGSLGFT